VALPADLRQIAAAAAASTDLRTSAATPGADLRASAAIPGADLRESADTRAGAAGLGPSLVC
jgi:hypothetical protein